MKDLTTAAPRRARRRPIRPLALAVALAAALLHAAPARADLDGAQVIDRTNASRAAHGFPAVAHDAAQSERCRRHARYMDLNDDLGHHEDPARPGYSEEGHAGGTSSVLAATSWRAGNPWINAPMHLSILLDPGTVRMGGYEYTGVEQPSKHWNCLGSHPHEQHPGPAADTFWSHPADGGRAPAAQTVVEAPYPPQVKVGIRKGVTVGPNLLLFWRGPEDRPPLYPLEASLVGADGSAAPARVLPTRSHDDVEGAGFGAAGDRTRSGYLIPTKPLRPKVRYQATVTWGTSPQDTDQPTTVCTDDGQGGMDCRDEPTPTRRATQTFTFTTEPYELTGNGERVPIADPNGPPRMKVVGAGNLASTVIVRIEASGRALGRRVTVKSRVGGLRARRRARLKPLLQVTLRRACPRPGARGSVTVKAKGLKAVRRRVRCR